MPLKFEVENLDDVPEALQEEYEEYEGRYRLKVEGVDDAKELKGALQKEREERKRAKERLAELEDERKAFEEKEAEKERQRLLEQEEFKSLWESEQQKARDMEERYTQLEREIQQKDVESNVNSLAAKHGAGEGHTELLKEQLLKYAKYNDGQVSYEVGGVPVPEEDVLGQLKGKYPSLFKGSGASGSGAAGVKPNGSGAAKRTPKGDFGGSRDERLAAIASRFEINE